MTWQGTIFSNIVELFEGVEGFFKFQALTVTVPLPTARVTQSSQFVPLGPGDVAFGERVAGADFNLGRIVFSGTGLTTGTIALGGGATMVGLTGGTITGLRYYYNDLLSNAIDQGLPYEPAMSLESNLRISAIISLPNVPAATLMNAIRQTYLQNNPDIFRAFLSSFPHVYTGTNGANIIGGFDGNDRLVGLAGNDFLQGNGGNDILDGGPGTDGLNGGEGSDLYLPGPPDPTAPVGDSVSDTGTGINDIDTVSYQNATSAVTVDLNSLDGDQGAGWARGLIAGGIERVIGSNFNDTLMGKDMPESIQGTSNDILIGGAGDDTLFGFQGSDTLHGGPGFDILVGGPDGDIRGPGPGDVAVFSASSSQVDVFFLNDGSQYVIAPGGGVDRLIQVEFLSLTNGTFAIGSFSPSTKNLQFGDGGNNTINGVSGADLMFGRAGNDTLNGALGNDLLEGDLGADRLNGGGGIDQMYGGDGNDIYYVDHVNDATIETSASAAGGNDLVYSSVSRTLGANLERLTLFGTGAVNGIGNGLANTVTGHAAANVLNGAAGNDRIIGASGNDLIAGGLGLDVVSGGPGRDTFVFNVSVSPAHRDIITDFVAADDTIRIENGIFTALGPATGFLTANKFWASATGVAHDADDRIVYNTTTGALIYDVNGSGAGGAFQFATLSTKPTITAADFFVI